MRHQRDAAVAVVYQQPAAVVYSGRMLVYFPAGTAGSVPAFAYFPAAVGIGKKRLVPVSVCFQVAADIGKKYSAQASVCIPVAADIGKRCSELHTRGLKRHPASICSFSLHFS